MTGLNIAFAAEDLGGIVPAISVCEGHQALIEAHRAFFLKPTRLRLLSQIAFFLLFLFPGCARSSVHPDPPPEAKFIVLIRLDSSSSLMRWWQCRTRWRAVCSIAGGCDPLALDAHGAKAYRNMEVDVLPYLKMAANRRLGTYPLEEVGTRVKKFSRHQSF